MKPIHLLEARRSRGPEGLQRVENVLRAAATVFRAKGYHAASLSDIADEAGLSKAGIYNYIDAKEDLLFTLTSEILDAHIENMERVQATEGPILFKLRCLVEWHVEFIIENFNNGRGFYVEFKNLPESFAKELVSRRRIYDRYVESLIERGQQQGVICRDLNPFAGQLMILTLLNTIFRWYDPDLVHWRRPEEARSIRGDLPGIYADFVIAAVACTPDSHVDGHRRHLGAVSLT